MKVSTRGSVSPARERRFANGATLSVVLDCEHRDAPWEERFEFTMRDIGGVDMMNEQHASKW
jgi:hypothetical protein